MPMGAPHDVQEDLVLQAAEHCRALRQALVARPSVAHRSRSSGLKKQQRQLQDEEQRLLMREQQELLEVQKRELHEQKDELEEKEEQLRRQRRELDEGRLYGDRCEQLAELRAKELATAKAHLLELQERLESSVDGFSEQQRSYEQCLKSWSAERLRVQGLQAEVAALSSRHSREIQELKDCLLPLRPSGGRCCLLAQPGPAQPTQSVLWGSVPLRPNLEDAWVQTAREVVDKGFHAEAVQELQAQQLQSQLKATGEQEALLEQLRGLQNIQEKLEHAEWKLETPEHVLHGELQQAYADLRDKESEVRMEKDRAEAISRAAEQRVELMRNQSQALMEQTRVQASQAALDYSMEQKRTASLDEELEASTAETRGLQEELLASRNELRLVGEEADLEQKNLRAALGAQLLECEQHCTRLVCDRQQQESVAAWLQDSWRRCELEPALDQVKALRKVMDGDQLHAEELQMQNHALVLELAEQRAAMSYSTTEAVFARAEVTAWKRESDELRAKLEKQEWRALEDEAAREEARFLEESLKKEEEAKGSKEGSAPPAADQAVSLAQELQELRTEAALLRSSLTAARIEAEAVPLATAPALAPNISETLPYPMRPPLDQATQCSLTLASVPMETLHYPLRPLPEQAMIQAPCRQEVDVDKE